MSWQMRVANNPCSFAVDIFIFRTLADGKGQYVSNLSGEAGVEVTMVEQAQLMRPAMTIDGTDGMLQAISDGLFNFGIRPTQEPILKNELTATKAHLEDMREIVGHTLVNLKKKEIASEGDEHRHNSTKRPQ